MIKCNYELCGMVIDSIEIISLIQEQKTALCNLYSEGNLVVSNAGYFYDDKGDNENFKNFPVEITYNELVNELNNKNVLETE